MARHSVRLYSRRSCHLCDDARTVIDAEAARDPDALSLDEVFIDGDDGLERQYGLRVPVVEVDGAERFEYVVDALELRALLA